MDVTPLPQAEALRLEEALLAHLGTDPTTVVLGSVSAELAGSDNSAVISWEGRATIDRQEFLDVNSLHLTTTTEPS